MHLLAYLPNFTVPILSPQASVNSDWEVILSEVRFSVSRGAKTPPLCKSMVLPSPGMLLPSPGMVLPCPGMVEESQLFWIQKPHF